MFVFVSLFAVVSPYPDLGNWDGIEVATILVTPQG